MPRRLFKILFFVSTVANLLGCSTTRVPERKRERIEVCVPDPRNDSLQCVEPQTDRASCLAKGFTWNLKWDRCELVRRFQDMETGTHICFPIDPITRILGDTNE